MFSFVLFIKYISLYFSKYLNEDLNFDWFLFLIYTMAKKYILSKKHPELWNKTQEIYFVAFKIGPIEFNITMPAHNPIFHAFLVGRFGYGSLRKFSFMYSIDSKRLPKVIILASGTGENHTGPYQASMALCQWH